MLRYTKFFSGDLFRFLSLGYPGVRGQVGGIIPLLRTFPATLILPQPPAISLSQPFSKMPLPTYEPWAKAWI